MATKRQINHKELVKLQKTYKHIVRNLGRDTHPSILLKRKLKGDYYVPQSKSDNKDLIATTKIPSTKENPKYEYDISDIVPFKEKS